MKGLIKRLDALPERLMQLACQSALSAAEHAAAIARESAPVDTGELRASISSASTPDGAAVTASAPHAPMVEYGTSKMPPRPFMLPAAHAVAGEFFKGVDLNKL